MTAEPTHLALALDGAGWHPAAWREPDAEPTRLFDPRRWVELVQEAERGLLDFVTIEDSLGLQNSGYGGYGPPDGRTDQVRGRLDAVLLAARIGPLTSHIGLVPTATTTHTEPFQLAKALATLDYVSTGRAGWRVQVSGRPAEAGHFGRRKLPELRPESLASLDDPEVAAPITDLFDEAADAVEVVRRLWDSWEDDAIIRDVGTGRFIDREKLHYIDFEGRFFSVKGPSIVPRPPQGQPLVTALGHARVPYRLGARATDVLFVTPHDDDQVAAILAEVGEEEVAVERSSPLMVFADLLVILDDLGDAARARKAALDERAEAELESDARIVVGAAAEVADLLEHWVSLGIQGFRLRAATIPDDVHAITRSLVPELQRRGLFRTEYEASTLRGLLGLSRPASRYAQAGL
jgi:alkanesulfonate monooxygenase SsuD/methylene tetrahydromethanopterin reductase-like flavin-dependent oxidoreductase (luciferase family)